MNKTKPPSDFNDNPEWTKETSAMALPAHIAHPPHVVAALVKNKGGRPRGSNKEQIALRLDKDVIAKFRATGPGWQSRINEILKQVRV